MGSRLGYTQASVGLERVRNLQLAFVQKAQTPPIPQHARAISPA